MRFSKRKLIVVGLAVVVGGAGTLAALEATDTVDVLPEFIDEALGDDEDESDNAAAKLAGGPEGLLVAGGGLLQIKEIESQNEIDLGEAPSDLITASLGSEWLAYLTSEPTDGKKQVPILHAFVPNGEDVEIGEGFSPLWDATGENLAYLRPTSGSVCTAFSCDGELEVVVRSISSGEDVVLTEAGAWALMAWAGDRILVAEVSETRSVSMEGDAATLKGLDPNEFVSASPDGRWLLVDRNGPGFVSLQDGTELGTIERLELDDQTLLSVTWSHDSAHLAAVVQLPPVEPVKGKKGKKQPTGADTQIVVFSPGDPEPKLVEQTYSATGSILWSVDNEAIAFPKLIDPKASIHQVHYCPISAEGACRVVTSYIEPLALLRMQ